MEVQTPLPLRPFVLQSDGRVMDAVLRIVCMRQENQHEWPVQIYGPGKPRFTIPRLSLSINKFLCVPVSLCVWSLIYITRYEASIVAQQEKSSKTLRYLAATFQYSLAVN